ncbi:isochorismatase family protein [Chloroflexota bacterium]
MPHQRSSIIYPAVLVIDMQSVFCTPGGSYEKYGGHIGADINAYRQIIPNIARVTSASRELQIPVFFTRDYTVLYQAEGQNTLGYPHVFGEHGMRRY